MPTSVESNYNEVAKTFAALADGWDAAVPDGLFKYIGPLIVQEMQSIAPVDTGALKAAIKMETSSRHTVTVVCDVPYAVPVDQGHRTRGATFVPANPFFSSVVGRYTGGELMKQARTKMNDYIKATFSHYKVRG